MSLPKLADYRNDLFATRANVTEALTYANEVCSTLPDTNASIAVRTAIHVILNTAIAIHKDEIAAIVLRHAELAAQRNDPLTEQIKALVREITKAELVNVDETIVSTLTKNIPELVKTAVDSAVGDKTQELIVECIESWVNDNLDEKIEDWSEQNLDLSDAVKTYIDDEVDWDDVIGNKIRSYFRNNSFTIEEN
jgi:predicted naringenin-chalcone synthase